MRIPLAARRNETRTALDEEAPPRRQEKNLGDPPVACALWATGGCGLAGGFIGCLAAAPRERRANRGCPCGCGARDAKILPPSDLHPHQGRDSSENARWTYSGLISGPLATCTCRLLFHLKLKTWPSRTVRLCMQLGPYSSIFSFF